MPDFMPQDGFQKKFLASKADIVIGGGKAGAGKTFALLLDAARNIGNPFYTGTIFRRTTPQIKNKGAIWDESHGIYSHMNAKPSEYRLQWTFPTGAQVNFSHLEYEKNIYDHQGGQYAFIGFDELPHFTARQFFYLLSRNRSKYCKPYLRATCNPDPDSWVSDLIQWWWDPDTGFPIPERDGVVRYFTRDGGELVWGDTVDEVIEKVPHILTKLSPEVTREDLVKSLTFIAGDIYENKELLRNNPEYLANLLALEDEEKMRLLEGSWKISLNEMGVFDPLAVDDMFSIVLNAEDNKKFGKAVTVDVARFGSNWAVIMDWDGLWCKRVHIWRKCDLEQLTNEIDESRKFIGCGKRECYVDVDGLGAGVVDFGKFSGFQNNGSAIDPKIAKRDESKKANYKNLKTQCYYKVGSLINFSNVSFEGCEYFVDGLKRDSIKTNAGTQKIEALIKRQLRVIRRKNPDRDGKKQINDKEEQKRLLAGMSPDLADTIMIRMLPIIKPRPRFAADSF